MKHLITIFVGCILLCLISISAAAQDTRVESEQVMGTTRDGSGRSTVPSSETHLDIRTANLAADATDPLHTCHNNDTTGSQPDRAGGYSVFTRITHPGGELFLSTATSNYDTVLSVFTYVDAGVPLGAALACNDDQTPGSVFTSFIDVNLPAGRYLVMVSRFSDSVAGAALSLKLDIGYLPAGVPPTNDNPNAPIALTAQQAYTQTGVHFATDSDTERALTMTCEMYNSVWYSFTAPTFGEYQFTSHGSILQVQPDSSYTYATAIGVYVEFFNTALQITEYLPVGCFSSVNYNAVTDPIYMSPGLTYHIRLGTRYNANILSGSKYKIKPVVTHVSLSTNDGFDDGLTGWKAAKFDVGDGVSGGIATINAGAVKKTLSQTKTSFPSYVKWAKGGMLHFSAAYGYTGLPAGKFTVTVAYSDGRPNTVVNAPFTTSNGGGVFMPIALASTKIKSVKMAVSVNPGSGASISVDYMVLEYDRDPSALRGVATEVLAFPAVK